MTTDFIHYFDRSGLKCTERVISHRGIIFHEIPYASPLLNAVHQLNRTPENTLIHFDRENLSHIFLFEPDGMGYSAIPCTFFRYANGLTLNEHRAVRSFCRRCGITPTEDTLIEILWGIRAGILTPHGAALAWQEAAFSKFGNRRRTRPGNDYSALMARLGSEIRNFNSGENLV